MRIVFDYSANFGGAFVNNKLTNPLVGTLLNN